MQNHAANFLAYLKDRNFSQNTIERYERVLGAFVEFLEANDGGEAFDPKGVTKGAVLSFLRHPGASGISPSSVVWNSRLACLRSFFGYLYREELVPENPAVKVEFSRPVPKDPVFLTYQEYMRLIDAVRKTAQPFYKDRDAAIVVTFYHTGLRLSELVSLDVNQVDWANEAFHEVKRKGGRIKDVHFNGEVTDALRIWLLKRERFGPPPTEPALFVSDRRKRLKPRSIERLFSHYSNLSDIGKNITPHVLRHSTATELLRRGEDIRVVSEVLNHTNLNTTKRYAHLMEGAEKRAVDRLAGG